MDDTVGGLEIKYVFNRDKSEEPSPLLESSSDVKEQNQNISTACETQQLLIKRIPYKLKDDAKREHQNKNVPSLLERNTNFTGTDESHYRRLKKINSDVNFVEPGVARGYDKISGLPYMISVADKCETKAGVVPAEEVERSTKEMSSKNSAVDRKPRSEGKLPADVINLKASGTRGATEDPKNSQISAKVTSDDSEGKTLKKTRDGGYFKVLDKMENRERNKRPPGPDKICNQPLKKLKSDDKQPPEGKRLELKVAHDADRSKEMFSKNLAVDSKPRNGGKSHSDVNNFKASGSRGTTEDPKNSKISAKVTSDDLEGKTLKKTRDDGSFKVPDNKVENRERNKRPTGSDKLCHQPLNKFKSDEKQGKRLELKVAHDSDRSKEISSKKLSADIKPRNEGKSSADVNYLKASGTHGITEYQKDSNISAKVTSGNLEGKMLKTTRDDGSFKVLDNKMGTNTNVRHSVALLEGKSISGIALDSLGNNENYKEAKVGQFGNSEKGLSMNKSLKAPALSTGEDKKKMYEEFVVSPCPNIRSSGRHKRARWEVRLNNAYNQGTAIVLYHLDPDYSAGEVEDIIWHAFKEKCEAKILPRTPESSPHYAQALILLETKEAAERILTELEEDCLMLSNGRLFMPVVGTRPPASAEKVFKFFGHLAIDKRRFQYQRQNEAVSTSHYPQPNTIEFDMAMEWFFLLFKFVKWWENFYELQGLELENLKKDLTETVHKGP